MKPQFSINGTTYHFQELTLRKFNALKPLLMEETTQNKMEIVSIITECPVSELRKLSYSDWSIVWDEAIFCITFFTSADDIITSFTHNGVEYALSNIEDITIGEFIDLDLILQEGLMNDTLARLATILYRPVVKRLKHKIEVAPYDPAESNFRAEEFLDIPIKYIKSANAFFLTSAQALQKNLLDSSNLTEILKSLSQSDREELQNLLQQDLGGWSSTELQETIHSIFRELLNSHSDRFSIGWLGKKLRQRGKLLNKSNKISEA